MADDRGTPTSTSAASSARLSSLENSSNGESNYEQWNVPVNGVNRNTVPNLNVKLFFELMKKETERLATFQRGKWPVAYISISALAKVGFFYLMNGDRVQCAFCHLILVDWETDDVPLNEHKRHNKRCPFLLGEDVGNVAIGKDPITGVESDDVCRSIPQASQLPYESAMVLSKTYNVSLTGSATEFGVLLHKEAKNRKFSTFASRKRSFAKRWSKGAKYTADELSDAGFFFTGINDCVKCFYCDGGLGGWNMSRDPWTEHAIRYPTCYYLILNKGSHFPEYCRKRYAEDVLRTVVLNEASIAEKTVNDWMKSKVVTDLLAVQTYPKDVVRSVLQERWNKCRSNFKKLDDLNSALIVFLNEKHFSQVKKSLDVSFNKDSDESLSSDPHSSMEVCEVSPSLTATTSKPRYDKDQILCKTCLDNEVSVVFLPCGHLISCAQCALGVTDCPICRCLIKGTVRVFFG